MGAGGSSVAAADAADGSSRRFRQRRRPITHAAAPSTRSDDGTCEAPQDVHAQSVNAVPAWLETSHVHDASDPQRRTGKAAACVSVLQLSANSPAWQSTSTTDTGATAAAAAGVPAQRIAVVLGASTAATPANAGPATVTPPMAERGSRTLITSTAVDPTQAGVNAPQPRFSCTMQDVTLAPAAATVPLPESPLRHVVVSVGDAAGARSAARHPLAADAPATPLLPPRTMRRRVAHKLPDYPGYAESMAALSAAAQRERDHRVQRAKEARAGTMQQGSEGSASAAESSSGGCGEFTVRVSKQMTDASQDLDTYTANMRLLLRSWVMVSEQYEDLVRELGEVMSARHPDYAQLFTTSSLSAQARVMLDMIGEALVIIARPSEMFSKLLEMGALHRRYNVGEEHFLALKAAFMSMLPKYLPAEMRGGCEAAWEPFWSIVIPLLLHGRTSARGDWHAAQQKEAFLAETGRIVDEIMARCSSSERGTFMLEMLESAVEQDPSMERFAVLRDRRTAIRAFTGLAHLLAGSTDLAATQLLMEDLAFRHSVFGLDTAAMRGFRQPFIETCHYSMWKRKCLELWHLDTPRALGEFWDYVTDSWATAMQSNAKARLAQAERAPDGSEPFCLMFTDIEGSTELWERNAAVMADAVEAHHRIVRGAIADYGAYEVKTVGDSFVIAAKSVLIAVRIALAVQLELMRAPIADGFEMTRAPQGGGPAHCWRSDSLRVRIGIHYCRDASAVYDSVQRRYDYYGPSVNCTARVESAACGGQILISEEALDVLQAMPEYSSAVAGAAAALKEDLAARAADRRDRHSSCSSMNEAQEQLSGSRPLSQMLVLRDWGEHIFKGIAKDVQVYSMLPVSLAERTFPLPGTSLASGVAASSLMSAVRSQVGSVVTGTKRVQMLPTGAGKELGVDDVIQL